jgi:hypothetical protein
MNLNRNNKQYDIRKIRTTKKKNQLLEEAPTISQPTRRNHKTIESSEPPPVGMVRPS